MTLPEPLQKIYSGSAFAQLTPTAQRLLASRALRSVSQGMLAVDFALYLHALGWSGAAIGGLLTAGGIFNSVGALGAGPLSDRIGRKALLLGYQVCLGLAAGAAVFTANAALISIACLLGGFGRGANGAAGPFGPVEQAWLGRETPGPLKARAYSLNSALGFYGMAVGSLLAAIPAWVGGYLHGSLSYRPLFGLSFLGAILVFLLVGQAHDDSKRVKGEPKKAPPAKLEIHEKHALWRLIGMNALNSSAIGLTGPLISYWFFTKFGVGPGILGPMQAVTFLTTGIASVLNGRLAERIGVVRAVMWSRSAGLFILLLLPIAPTYGLAAVLYILRSIFNRGTIGTRQALTSSLLSAEHQGLVFSVSASSATFPQALGPMLSGPMIAAGWFETPFYMSAVLQALYVGFYGKVFGRYDPMQNPGSPPSPTPTPAEG